MNEQPSARATRRTAGDATGTVVAGRYVIQRAIARGGMATVYLADDSLLNRPVALKVLAGDADAEEEDSFLREARAVAKLNHPNIVDVYDAGVEGSLRYIVMQYVPGGTLREIIQREAPLDPRRAVELTIRLADALNFGHTRGIVHCDIKPGNVLLGDHGEPKITDFGIARSLTGTADLSDTIAGTVGYVSPEQVEGGPIDGRADVYSLAAVLYEMLSGAPPYTGDNLIAVAAQRLVTPPIPLRERNPFVPEDLDEAVMRGLARDPATRFPTAKSFADALRGHLAGATDTPTRPMPRAPQRFTERVPVSQRRVSGTSRPPSPTVPAPRRGSGRPWLFFVLAGTLVAVTVALIVVLAVTLAGGDSGAPTTVPRVIGDELGTAALRIRDAGLRVGDVELVNAEQALGTVIDQTPAEGDGRRTGDAVRLTVSVGPRAP